ncbi:FtsX-like permease family protein [Desulfosporosinus sp.]|uniref:ABC transporter permease n=1 Tax=Desulfosporosinus sp. TaxID=157907 RepID=UPI00230C5891|nr:FtsX-like permease family protein [Desulfosporosinus sp.]MDA8220248.1 FtsX-like permease family protein [Desulfitobacterium hafniense]
MTKQAMYLRMVTAALKNRKSRVAIALLALVLGIGVISGLLSVYNDITLKMSKELRSYGANLVLVPTQQQEGSTLELAKLNQVLEQVPQEKTIGYSPYLYGIVTGNKQRFVAVGVDFSGIQKVSPYWRLDGAWPNENNQIVVGSALAEQLELNVGQKLSITAEETGKTESLQVVGMVSTGSTEDYQVFLELKKAQGLLGKEGQIHTAYLSVMGNSAELITLAETISQAEPGIKANPIQQIARSEGVILEKIRTLVYLVVIVILASTLLCVSTTMMAMVMERRREIGLRKALGATNRAIAGEFLGESALLGITGGVLGSLVGWGIAQVIGLSVFKAYITFRPSVLMAVIILSVLVAWAAVIMPVRTAANIEPALVLKGE